VTLQIKEQSRGPRDSKLKLVLRHRMIIISESRGVSRIFFVRGGGGFESSFLG